FPEWGAVELVRQPAPFDGEGTVDDHGVDADGVAARLAERCGLVDGRDIEDDEVGIVVDRDAASTSQPGGGGRQGGALTHGLCDVEEPLVADEGRERAGE